MWPVYTTHQSQSSSDHIRQRVAPPGGVTKWSRKSLWRQHRWQLQVRTSESIRSTREITWETSKESITKAWGSSVCTVDERSQKKYFLEDSRCTKAPSIPWDHQKNIDKRLILVWSMFTNVRLPWDTEPCLKCSFKGSSPGKAIEWDGRTTTNRKMGRNDLTIQISTLRTVQDFPHQRPRQRQTRLPLEIESLKVLRRRLGGAEALQLKHPLHPQHIDLKQWMAAVAIPSLYNFMIVYKKSTQSVKRENVYGKCYCRVGIYPISRESACDETFGNSMKLLSSVPWPWHPHHYKWLQMLWRPLSLKAKLEDGQGPGRSHSRGSS